MKKNSIIDRWLVAEDLPWHPVPAAKAVVADLVKEGPHGYIHGWIKVAPGDRLSGWSKLSQGHNHLGITPEFPNESVISSHSVPGHLGEVRVAHSVNTGDAMPTTTVTAGSSHDLAGWNAGDDGKTVILDHTDPGVGPQLDQALSDGLVGKTTHVPGSDWGDLQVTPHADGVKLTVLPYQGEVDDPETRQEFVKRVISEGKQTDLEDEEPPRTDQEWQAFADLAWQDELAERAADEAANATPDLSAVLTPAQVADLRDKLRIPDPAPATKAFNPAEARDDHGRWTLLGAAIHSLANLSDHEFAQHFGPPVGEKHVEDTGIRVTAHDSGHVVLSVNDGAGHTPLARLTPDEAENLGIGLSDMANDSLNHDPEDYPDTGNSEIIDDSTGHRLALADHQPHAAYDNTGDVHLVVPNGNRDGADLHEEMSADSAWNLETALDDMASLATDAADRRADREAEQELAAQQAAADAAWEAANATRGRPGDVDTHQWWQTHGTVLPDGTGVAMLDDHTIGIRYNPHEGDSNTETAEVPTTAAANMVEALRYLRQQINANPDHPDGYLVTDHLSVDYRDGEVTITDEANNTETTIWNEDIDPLIAELQRLAATKPAVKNAAPTVEGQHVYNQLLANYPAKALGWVKDAQWTGPVQVPQDEVDYDDLNKWAASHQPARVRHFVKRIRAGDVLRPAVAVREPGETKVKIIDGHHRVLAYRQLGRPAPAYVGQVGSSSGPWNETHVYQIHQGADPANKDAVHGHHVSGTPAEYSHGWVPVVADISHLVAQHPEEVPAEKADEWGRQHFVRPETLPLASRQALVKWTDEAFHGQINHYLRTGQIGGDAKNQEQIRRVAASLQEVLDRHRVPVDVKVYRCVPLDAFGGQSPDKLVGQLLQDKGFLPTTVTHEVLNQPVFSTHPVRMTIAVPKGTPGFYVGRLGSYPEENELLLGSGLRLAVTSAVHDGKYWQVQAWVVKDG